MAVDVEAVDEIALPDAAEFILYGGKGGVGKTTMAAATGIGSAIDGIETLVVSTDPAHSLSDTLGMDVGPAPTRVDEDLPLWVVEIDPEAAMEEAVLFDQAGGLGGIGELLGGPGEGGDDFDLAGSMPGADEAAAIQQLLRFMDDPRFDRVIIDTAPTGHTLRLLELPELLDSMVGRLAKLRERVSGLLDGLGGLVGSADSEVEDGPDLDELRDRIERLRAVLCDPERTDFRVVVIPEVMSVLEAERLAARLQEFGIPVGTVIVNRVMEPLADVTEVEMTVDLVEPNIEACAFCQRRWEVQQTALERAHELFRRHTIRRVPLFADEVRGRAMLRVVAACLTE